jgi:hypothetical protein
MTTTFSSKSKFRAIIAFAVMSTAFWVSATANAALNTLVSSGTPAGSSGLSDSYCGAVNGACVNNSFTYNPHYVYEEFTVPANTTISAIGIYSYFGLTGQANIQNNYTSTNWVVMSATSGITFSQSGTSVGTLTFVTARGDPTLVTVGGLSVHIQYAGTYWVGIENNIKSATVPTVFAYGNAAYQYAARLGDASGPTTGPLPPAAFFIDGPAAPEPSTWAMMLLGFVGLGWLGRRRLARARARSA